MGVDCGTVILHGKSILIGFALRARAERRALAWRAREAPEGATRPVFDAPTPTPRSAATIARVAAHAGAALVPHARQAARPMVVLALVLLGLALVLGRVPLPVGDSFGYASAARNVVVLALAGVLLRAPGFSVPRSPSGLALIAFVLAAIPSIVASGGHWGAFRSLATAAGLFMVIRAIAADERGRSRLLFGLGVVACAIALREIAHQPGVLGLDESHRFALVTDHANTLGFAGALLAPLFLRPALQAGRTRVAWLAFAASTLIVAISFSRAAWIALALACVATWRGGCRTRRSRASAARAGVIAIAAMAAAAAVLSLERIEADAQRLRIAATSLSLFRDHWLAGTGFGSRNLERVFAERYLERYGESLFLFHSHNLYVDVLTGTGVIGAIAAAVLIATLVRVAWRGVVHAAVERRREATAYAAALGVFLLLAMVDTPLYHGRLLLLLAVVWAMTEAATADLHGSRRPGADVLHQSGAAAHKSGSNAELDREEPASTRRRRAAPALQKGSGRPA